MKNPITCTLPGQVGRAATALLGCLLVSACSSLPKGDIAIDLGIKDRGVASWYGEAFHGKLTANGEVFDKTALTAAHRKLPLGSVVRVMNLHNGRVVKVRVTDRGPYVPGRILDLSEAAARELGMVEAGTAAIQLEVLGEHQVVPPHPQNQRVLILTVQSLAEAAKRSDLALDDLERRRCLPERCRRTCGMSGGNAAEASDWSIPTRMSKRLAGSTVSKRPISCKTDAIVRGTREV